MSSSWPRAAGRTASIASMTARPAVASLSDAMRSACRPTTQQDRWLIVAGSFVGFSAYLWLLRNVRTTLVSTYAYVNPIVAVTLGVIVLDEALTGRMFLSGAIVLASVALLEWMRPAGSAASLCILRNVTGLPCPTCGSTRAARALAAGRPIEALRHNPLVVTASACGAALLLWRAVRAPRRREAARRPCNGAALAVAAVALLVANWCYLLAQNARQDAGQVTETRRFVWR